MRENRTEKISIRVHPAVFRYLDSNFPKTGSAYDLRRHFLHDFLRAGLTRQPDTEKPPKAFIGYTEIKVVFTHRDCRQNGFSISESHQAAFSRLAYKFIQQTACHEVLYAHVAGGIPRDTAIKEYLLENLYEEHELNYAALRKYYQRNWMETEKHVLEEYGRLTGGKQPVRNIIICTKNVPFYQ